MGAALTSFIRGATASNAVDSVLMSFFEIILSRSPGAHAGKGIDGNKIARFIR